MILCQVISTSKYREALTLRSIPIIPLLGVNPSHPVITDRTQFTLLHSWCGKFVITHHQHALWVLDPSCSSVVATLAERLPIIDITCYKDSVYLLRPDKCPVVKLTIHTDFKRLLALNKGISSSCSDLLSTLDSGSYQMSVKVPMNDCNSKPSTGSSPVVINTTSISFKGVVLPSQGVPQMSLDLQDGGCVKDKIVAGMSPIETPVEDQLHKLHTSLPHVESSSIAVQSVLKKKKKKKKKAAISHDTTG